MATMQRRGFLGWLASGLAGVSGGFRPAGGGAPAALDDLLEAGGRLLDEHLDPAVLGALRSGDVGQIEALLAKLTATFQADDVLDLAAMQDAVDLALPWMDSVPRLKPYASWLRARKDYFQVAEDFEQSRRAGTGGQGPAPAPGANPTPEQERKAWNRQVAKQEMPKGAAVWVPRLKPVFKAAGAPPELVWLAEVESGFDPLARSPAGAAGLYQLMPATAQGLGLKLQPQDERLVPEKNARAGATYLRQMYRQFKDWRLALAAYNAGPGRVTDLLRRRRATSFDAIAPSLPAETQMYVPKFEAVLQRREKTGLPALKLPAPA
jgi:membrane-bound lytic murein transglycosylase D